MSAARRLAATLAAAGLLAPLAAREAAGTTAPGVERYQRVVVGAHALSVRATRIRGAGRNALIVVFEIRNESRVTRRFKVGYYRSAPIRPGQTLNASVAFRRPGPVACLATAPRHAPLRARFRIVA